MSGIILVKIAIYLAVVSAAFVIAICILGGGEDQ